MKTIQKLLLSVTVIAACTQTPVWAHASLEIAVPGKNAQLTAPPKEVALHFNESVEANFSSIKVLDAGGKTVSMKKATVDSADPKTLRARIGTLKSGRYTVQWVGVGRDGHRRTGDYQFTVK